MAKKKAGTSNAPASVRPLALDPLGVVNPKAEVKVLQRALKGKGFNPGAIDGIFGNGTQAAVMALQLSNGLLADGVVGPRTRAALAGQSPAQANAQALPSVIGNSSNPGDCAVSAGIASQMFPHTPIANINANLPPVLNALRDRQLHDKVMVLASLATIRAETESFRPIAEGISRYNTSPGGGHPFDLYDYRSDLGNQGPPDGQRFCGRGYVQLTGKYNYREYGAKLQVDLEGDPDLANDPANAAAILAQFMRDRERPIKEALLVGDFARARRMVNGGSHGLDRFAEAYRIGYALIG